MFPETGLRGSAAMARRFGRPIGKLVLQRHCPQTVPPPPSSAKQRHIQIYSDGVWKMPLNTAAGEKKLLLTFSASQMEKDFNFILEATFCACCYLGSPRRTPAVTEPAGGPEPETAVLGSATRHVAPDVIRQGSVPSR